MRLYYKKKRTGKIIHSCSSDHIDEIPKLLPSFNFYASHYDIESGGIPENAAFFYSVCYLSTWKVVKTETIYLDMAEYPLLQFLNSCSFCDWPSSCMITGDSTEAIELHLEINRRTYFIGVYAPSLNTLVATDWVHSNTAMKIASIVIPKLYEQKILAEKPIKVKKGSLKVTLGCDPEFEVLTRGKNVISARSLHITWEGKVGRDGAGDQLELRPQCKETPEELVEEVKGLLEEFKSRYKDCSLSVKGDNYPLGGHVHFGSTKSPLPLTSDFIKLLDEWLGKPLIGLSGEARGSYKRLNAYEKKAWGFEYRSLPAAIFQKPKVATAVLKVCKVLAEKYYKGKGVEEVPTLEEIKRLKLLRAMNTIKKFISTYDKGKSIYRFWKLKEKEV